MDGNLPIPDAPHAQAAAEVATVLPDRAGDLARLQLITTATAPVVTVVGKYNHGKSSLLNALLGQPAFAVSDRRQTVGLDGLDHGGARWLDAPGLDADVGSGDDQLALQAIWLHADVRLFVHAAKEGELDAAERALLERLHADQTGSGRQLLLVLSQADQVADEAQLGRVSAALAAQVPWIAPQTVSTLRHQKGMAGSKPLLLERSGIPALQQALRQALAQVPAARSREAAALLSAIGQELATLGQAQQGQLQASRAAARQQRQAFDQGLQAELERAGRDIQAMLDNLGTDHAIVPDRAGDIYASTAGKRERSYIQIAYSRACIRLDGYLAGHGVGELPPEQRTTSSSINSVMIAVLGISVKFRADLQRMFCQADGRERLHEAFCGYYERSGARRALAARIQAQAAALVATDRAAAALAAWDSGA